MADEMTGERDFNQRNIDEFRANGGKVGGQFEGFPLLLLTSTGAKSGEQRVNPVAYFDIDDSIYVVASSAGRDRDPSWAFNIRAHPEASVEIGTDPPRPVTARELPRDERDRIYDVVVQRAPGFGDYQRQTDREQYLADLHVGAVAVERPARAPLAVPIWYGYRPGGEVLLWTESESVKHKLIRDAGRSSITVQDERPPALQVRDRRGRCHRYRTRRGRGGPCDRGALPG